MDFESPDVAKEFPGLYMGDLEVGTKSEGIDYEDESDKSKKKKDKKKDKDKGYAALAGESSHDEDDESKSPGKSKKIKAFKLSSGKKKEKEPKSAETHSHPHPNLSSLLRTGSIREKRPFDREKKPSEKELRKSAEKEVKSQASTSASTSGGHGSANPRLSLPTSVLGKITHPPPERTHSLTRNLTLNAFLNAPAPLLKKKEGSAGQKEKVKDSAKKEKDKSRSKDKESKKGKEKESAIPSLSRLKLKRGSKNSLEESHSDSQVAPCHQFPESPDAIAKEIRRYENLLEQMHAQIKSNKKVSKKSEEQLWELQRTLTQLKRKLRSVNALSSASSANIVLPTTTSEKIVKVPEKPIVTSVSPKPAPVVLSSGIGGPITSIPIPKITPADKNKPTTAVSSKSANGSSQEHVKLDLTLNQGLAPASATAVTSKKEPSSPLPLESQEVVVSPSEHLDTSVVEVIGEESKVKGIAVEEIQKDIAVDKGKIHTNTSPGATSLEKVQVHVQVHSNADSIRESILTPEDIFEKEFESFSGKSVEEPVRNCPSPIIMGDCPSTGSIVKSDVTPDISVGDSDVSTRGDVEGSEDEDYVEIRKNEEPLLSQTEGSPDPDDFVPAFIVEEETDSDFDPFTLPLFQTDEFIALENEALIAFNQKLQDEIVREEEKVNSLMDEYKYLTDAGYRRNAMDDLENLDDDELAELWYSRKVENEALQEKVSHLRAQVVAGILAEFRLETRRNYLEEKVAVNNLDSNPTQLQTEISDF